MEQLLPVERSAARPTRGRVVQKRTYVVRRERTPRGGFREPEGLTRPE